MEVQLKTSFPSCQADGIFLVSKHLLIFTLPCWRRSRGAGSSGAWRRPAGSCVLQLASRSSSAWQDLVKEIINVSEICLEAKTNLAINGFHASWELGVIVLLTEEVHVRTKIFLWLVIVAHLWIYVFCVLKERAIHLYLRGSTDGIKMGLFYIVLGRVKTLNQFVWNKNPTCWILHFDHSTHSAGKSNLSSGPRKIDLPVYVAEVEECLSFWLPWNG